MDGEGPGCWENGKLGIVDGQGAVTIYRPPFAINVIFGAIMYKLIRNIIFWFDDEKVHLCSMKLLKGSCGVSFVKKILQNTFTPQRGSLERNVFGLIFSNPVGLAAGFDKNAKYLQELTTLGFGFVEIG